jgi:ATP-dependent RNA helicase DeaD
MKRWARRPGETVTDPTREEEGNVPADQTDSTDSAAEAAETSDAAAEDAAPEAAAEAAAADDSSDVNEADVGETVVASDYNSDRQFSDFPISPEVLQGLTEKGYATATGVQAAAIEPAIAGRDLVVRSKTGTGKTAAFCIPMVERIKAGDRKTRAIVLAPTRELARQVAQECTAIAQYKDIRVTVIYGGVAFGPQEDALKAGTEIVVGTPGRILDHLRRGNLDLSEASFATLDEADEMLSMGFMQDVMKILDQTPKGRQMLMFSATVDDRVRSLITRYTNNALDIRLSTDTDKVEGIAHVLYETSPNFHKVRALLALIDQEEPVSALIFCNTREDTATVATFLSRQGLDVELISGELPQNKREKVMDRVRSGQTQYLAATDVAARGIDISHLTHVINYSLPDDPAVYLHRTGRVGRIGRKGVAISLVGGQDIHTRNTLERQYEIAFEMREMPTPEEATAARVDRQAKAIRKAMGTMAFEGYIGTVRAIKKRPDGDLLLAAALRAFFLWDRMRKAEEGTSGDSVEALQKAREEKQERRGSKGGGDRRRRRRRNDRGDRGDRNRR